jgi:hypothetical protein
LRHDLVTYVFLFYVYRTRSKNFVPIDSFDRRELIELGEALTGKRLTEFDDLFGGLKANSRQTLSKTLCSQVIEVDPIVDRRQRLDDDRCFWLILLKIPPTTAD